MSERTDFIARMVSWLNQEVAPKGVDVHSRR